jgi:hypothetical protein
MTKGILLIALGHENYMKMAVNLAMSIKCNEPELQIALATDREVRPEYRALFDKVKTVPKKAYMAGVKVEFIKAKLFMYDLSPFDETLFLDVDQIVIPGRKLTSIFSELRDIDFTMSNTGLAGMSIWADMAEVKTLYGDKPYWNFHSELVYFKKCDRAKQFFEAAKKVFADNKIKSAHRFSGSTMADELAFQVAAIVTGIYPHAENWTPNFWWSRDRKFRGKYPYQLKEYFTYSIGGNHTPAFIKQQYNNLAAFYSARMKLQNAYKLTDKRNFLPERVKF